MRDKMNKWMRYLKSVMCVFTVAVAVVLSSRANVMTVKAAETEAAVTANKTTVKKGLVEEKGDLYFYAKGKKVKNTWKTIKKEKYFFDAKGKALKGVAKAKGVYYFFGEDGKLFNTGKAVMKTSADGKNTYIVLKGGKVYCGGWYTFQKKLYYTKSNGTLVKNKTVNGIKLTKTGEAKKDGNYKAIITAANVVNRISNPSASKGARLRAAWNYLVGGSFGYASKYPRISRSGYTSLAVNMLSSHSGNCYGFACAFALMAKAIGYNAYVVNGMVPGTRDQRADGMTRHSWVIINGAWYDPEAQYKGWNRGVYGSGAVGGYTIRSVTKM